MNRYYYTDKFKTDGKTLGPVSIEELDQLYIKQEITEKCLVCIEGTEEWHSYLEVLKQFNDQKREIRKNQKEKDLVLCRHCKLLTESKSKRCKFCNKRLLPISKGEIIMLKSIGGIKALTLLTIFAWLIGLIVVVFLNVSEDKDGSNKRATPCEVCGAERGYYRDGGFGQQRVIRCKTCDAVK